MRLPYIAYRSTMSSRGLMKRVMDVIAALIGLSVLWPVMLVIAILIRRFLGAPIYFKQFRPGLNGQPFQLLKFRTMTNACSSSGELLPDSERLTPLGRILRRTSIDELPQLWNVLRGELSLVGPRPLLMQYLDRYTPEQMRRHEVKPGITGWAQVSGRNAISWERKFALDVWYVDNWSLILDARILLLSVASVISGKGTYSDGQETVEEFMGT